MDNSTSALNEWYKHSHLLIQVFQSEYLLKKRSKISEEN